MDVVLMGFVWALLLIPGCARGGRYEGRLIMEPAEWPDARIACGNLSDLSYAVSCDLTTHSPREDGDFWRSQTLTPGLDYWVGARALDVLQWHASGVALIQAQGCYEAPNSALLVRHNALGPERCLVRCDGHIVAMKASQCFCLTENVLSTFAKRPDEECHIFCDRESERCGGSDGNLVSVYKMPAHSVLKKSTNKDTRTTRDWFMYRSHTNHQELLVISNAPERSVPNKAILCVNSSGTYEVVSIKSHCSASSKAPSFDSQDVLQFLRATADVMGVSNTRYQLPLSAARRVQWLDGKEANNDTEGRGDCTSVRYYGGQYTLTNRRCKDRLPIVCSCYSKPETATSTPSTTTTTATIITTATATTTTTTNATTTTTTETASSTVPDTSDLITTISLAERNSTALPSSTAAESASSTTAATAPATTTAGLAARTKDQSTFSTEGMTTPKPTMTVRTATPLPTVTSTGAVSSAEMNSTSSEPSSPAEATTTAQIPVTSPLGPVVAVVTNPSPSITTTTTTATTAKPSTPATAAASTTLTMAAKTQTASFASSVTSSTSSALSTIMKMTTTKPLITGSSVIAETTAPSRPTAPPTSKASTTENDKWKVEENSTLLFPFDAMTEEKKADVPLQSAPNLAKSQPSNAVKGGAATASFSVELIVGVTVAVIVVAVVIIIVIVVIQRRKK